MKGFDYIYIDRATGESFTYRELEERYLKDFPNYDAFCRFVDQSFIEKYTKIR